MSPVADGQRTIASFFGGGGPAKKADAANKDAPKKREAHLKDAIAKEEQVENVPPPATKRPRLQKKSDVEAATNKPEPKAGPEPEPAAAAVMPDAEMDEAEENKEVKADEAAVDLKKKEEEEEEKTEVKHPVAPPSPVEVAPPTEKNKTPVTSTFHATKVTEVVKPEPKAEKDDNYEEEEEDDDEDEDEEDEDEDDVSDDDKDVDEAKTTTAVDGVAKVMKAGGGGGGAGKTVKPKKKKRGKATKDATANAAGVGDGSVEAAGRLLSHDPTAAVTWKSGESVPYLFMADVFEEISNTTKRLEIAEMLTNAFRTILASSPQDLLAAVYLASNTIAPQHEGVDLGIGDATLIKALAEATGRKESAIKADYKEEGDLGIVAMESRSTQKTMFAPPKLTVSGVLKEFRAIAMTEGKNSVDAKKAKMKKLLVASRGCEPGYIVRSLQGKLRIGLAQQTVNHALAHAMVLHSTAAQEKREAEGVSGVADLLGAAVEIVKQVFSECPSYDEIIPAMLMLMEGEGIEKLPERCHLRVGVPVKPMLAKPTHGVQEVVERFTDVEFTCEYKYDGERAQIHLSEDGKIKIFSRNQEDNTSKFPDVIRALPGYLKDGVTSLVIDCEAVAFDRVEKKILPFQILSTRGRKNIDEADIKVHVALYAFDCLYLNGVNLLQESLTKRREALYSAFKEVPGEFYFATAKISRDVEELQTFLEDSITENTEGLIVKTMDATYEPSKRSLNWLKLKKDYLEGCGDSLDLVPIGAFHGRGKRTGVYGAYLLACYDEDSEELQSICKIGTGFSDEDLNKLAESLRGTVIDEPRSYFKFGEGLKPDVWFEPKHVWEVKAADLSVSPVHQAAHGLVDPVKGIALRFPRFLRVREDKGVEQATSAEQVADFYNAQATKQEFNNGGGAGDDDIF